MSDENTFSPRPEAHAMELSKMLAPVEKATYDLLKRIHGAIQTAHQEKSATSPANCFLVTGERGTGKTTVLLSAKELVNPRDGKSNEGRSPSDNLNSPKVNPNDDKTNPKENKDKEEKAARNEEIQGLAKKIADRAEWLDVLDVEPLHPKTNLLTVLLIRIRNAIDRRTEGKHGEPRASLFEERAGSARDKLDKLIQDAALIWEDIQEASTVDRANRQIAMAEAFSRFKRDFDETFKALGGERASARGTEESRAFVLPIDNIDRSPEHLQSIFKLAQMVSSKHLWLVLAGDRVDLNTLLERVYWKELFQTSVGTVSGAKEHRGEDESLSIARRQAAATIRKILPPNHRIEVKLVEPDEALAFKLTRDGKTLLELLENIPIFNTNEKDTTPKPPAMAERTNLAALLTLDDCFESDVKTLLPKGDSKNLLVLHGRDALRLPARTLLDLAQLAQRESVKSDREKEHSAAYIARSMYRLAIAESALPEWLTEDLQERLVQRFGERTTINTDEHGQALELVRVRQPICTVPGSERRSQLDLVKSQDVLLTVSLGKEESPEHLPDIAAGWLLVLHDVLTIIPKPLVFYGKERLPENAGEHVNVSWRLPEKGGSILLSLKWPYPKWRTVFEMSAASMAWRWVLKHLEEPGRLSLAPEQLRKVLALAWLDIACWLAGRPERGAEQKGVERWPTKEIAQIFGEKANIDAIGQQIVGRAAGLLKELDQRFSNASPLLGGSDWRDGVAYDWLRFDLPLFFMPELDTGLTWDDAKALHGVWEKDKDEMKAHRVAQLREAVAEEEGEVDKDKLRAVIGHFNEHPKNPFEMDLPKNDKEA